MGFGCCHDGFSAVDLAKVYPSPLWFGFSPLDCPRRFSNFLSVESVVVIPPHGVQFETHRGLPSWPLMTARSFIPMIYLHDFVINEGLHRWNVRFYLTAIKQSGDQVSLQVAYEVGCYQVILPICLELGV